MAVIGRVVESLGGEDKALTVGGGDADLGAELVATRRLTAVEAGHFRSVQAVELGLAVLGLDEQPFDQAKQPGEALLQVRIAGDLPADVAVEPSEIGLEAVGSRGASGDTAERDRNAAL